MRFAALFANWRANIIPTSPRTRRPLKKNLRRSTKRTRYWATQRNERNTTSSAQIGTDRADSSRRHRWGPQPTEGGYYQWGGDGGGVQFEFGGTGFSDFFEAFFGGGRGRSAFGGFGGRQATAERGADVEADIMVTLEEALNGSTRTVSLRRAGSNKVENYQVKIPRGVREGQRIRLAGQGEAGVGGGKSGDLFLRVRLARHPDFSVEGSDLIHEVKIEPWRAVLGSELLVPTLEGKVRLKIPPGTQGGQRFRLRERGLPGVSGKRGDLYVEVHINVPKKLTEREREIWNELAKLHGT